MSEESAAQWRRARRTAIEQALAGATAGITGTLLGYPLDVIKARMQTHPEIYRSAVGTALRLARDEGLFSLYRGVSMPLCALTALNTLNFYVYAQNRVLLGIHDDVASPWRMSGFDVRVPVAGALVAPWSVLISTPFDAIKLQMQLSVVNGGPLLRRPLDALRHILMVRGPQGLFIGGSTNLAREVVFISVYFGLYEHLKAPLSRLLAPDGHGPGTAASIAFAGGVSGATAWAASFPLDCIKSIIQGRRLEPAGSPAGPSAWSVATSLIRARGIIALYAGLGPSVLRAFLVSATRFSAYEGAMQCLRGA